MTATSQYQCEHSKTAAPFARMVVLQCRTDGDKYCVVSYGDQRMTNGWLSSCRWRAITASSTCSADNSGQYRCEQHPKQRRRMIY